MEENRPQVLLTAQGSIQLITAFAAYTQLGIKNAEVTLAIYQLSTPAETRSAFQAFLIQMAELLGTFKEIIFLEDELIYSANLPGIKEKLGATVFKQIFVCTPWQHGNKALLNLYPQSEKICYGDSIGLYIPEFYFSNSSYPLFALKKWVKCLLGKDKLKDVKLDRLVLTYTKSLKGKLPLLPQQLLAANLEKTFQALLPLVNTSNFKSLLDRLKNQKVAFCMTVNFSESGRMTKTDELKAYQDFILGQKLAKDTILCIKPHPRDHFDKLEILKTHLKQHFKEIICINNPEQAFTPFELFAFNLKSIPLQSLTLLTFSTACLPLNKIVGVKPLVGFTPILVNKYFLPDFRKARIQHEADLIHLMEEKS